MLKREKEKNLQKIGQNAFAAIEEMVAALHQAFEADNNEAIEEAQQRIFDDPLSVMVRADWHFPTTNFVKPEEYEILLSTGGPATRIVGALDECCQPATAELQAQDWFLPWTRIEGVVESVLLDYASNFYFGE